MIRTALLFVIAYFIGLFIQATLLHSIFPDVIAPDVLLMLVVFLGLRTRTPGGAVGAFLIGLGGDFASAKFLGPFAAGSVAAFLVTTFVANHLFSEKGFTVAVTAFIASISKNLAAATVISLFTDVELMQWSFIYVLILEAIFTAVVCPFVIYALTWGHAVTSYGPVALRSSYRRV